MMKFMFKKKFMFTIQNENKQKEKYAHTKLCQIMQKKFLQEIYECYRILLQQEIKKIEELGYRMSRDSPNILRWIRPNAPNP